MLSRRAIKISRRVIRESRKECVFFGQKNRKTENILQPYITAGEHTVKVLKRSSSVSKKQIPENDEFSENHGMKIFFRKTIKPKDTTVPNKTAGEPWPEPWEERAAGFWDSQPAIPIVFADGSLRTHNLKLVGQNYRTLRKHMETS